MLSLSLSLTFEGGNVVTKNKCCVHQVLEIESRNVKALYRRAQAYIQLADLELAEIDVKKALEIDPDNRSSLSLSLSIYICQSVLSIYLSVRQSVIHSVNQSIYSCACHSVNLSLSLLLFSSVSQSIYLAVTLTPWNLAGT